MCVSSQHDIRSTKNIKQLFSFLKDQFADDVLIANFNITKRAFKRALNKGVLDTESLKHIGDFCGISMCNFFEGNIDLNCVGSKLRGEEYTASRYLVNNYSSRRVAHNILNNCPKPVVSDALNYLQIKKSFFFNENIDKKISTVMNSDLLFYLHRYHGYSNYHMKKLGMLSGFYNIGRPFGNAFNNLSIKESYEKVVEEISRHFETSFLYEIVSIKSRKAIIRKHLTEKMKNGLKQDIYSNSYICKYVEGSLSAVSFYTSNKFSMDLRIGACF